MNSLKPKIETQVSVKFPTCQCFEVCDIVCTSSDINWNGNYKIFVIAYSRDSRFLQRSRVFCVMCFCQLVHLVICVLQCAYVFKLLSCFIKDWQEGHEDIRNGCKSDKWSGNSLPTETSFHSWGINNNLWACTAQSGPCL